MKIVTDLFLAAYATLMAVVYGSVLYNGGVQIPQPSRYFSSPLWEMWMVDFGMVAIGVGIALIALWLWRQVWLDVRSLQTPGYDDVPFDL